MSKYRIAWWVNFLAVITLILVSLSIGRYYVPIDSVVRILWGKLLGLPLNSPSVYEVVILRIRLPRIILAFFIGGGLSMAGAALQSMFSNPLVSSDILGVSSGAGFGASLGILLVGNGIFSQILSLAFGILTVGAIYFLVRDSSKPVYVLVLSGVIISSLFQALISILKFVADPEDKLPVLTYWLMGSLSNASYHDMLLALPLLLTGITTLWLLRWRMNLLFLPTEELISLGTAVKRLKGFVIISSTFIVASSVAIGGIISWVGLIIPHIVRIFWGDNNQNVLPFCFLLGGAYLVFIDTLARTISPSEIPISILTALIGAPFFAFLLKRLYRGVL